MDGRAFLGSVQHLLGVDNEANRRSAAGRLYLALLHEANAVLERWGFPRPAQDDSYSFVTSRCNTLTHTELLQIKVGVEELRDLTQIADHALVSAGRFADAVEISRRRFLAEGLIDLLDQIDNDPARRAATVADIRSRWP
jgi:hypothetical protein